MNMREGLPLDENARPELDVPGRSETVARSARRNGLLVAGVALLLFSLWAFFDNVQVSGGFWGRWGLGDRGFGWSLVPLLAGVIWVVVNRHSLLAWGLVVIGVSILGLEVLSSLHFYFRATSLTTVLLMLVPGAIGIGLVARNL